MTSGEGLITHPTLFICSGGYAPEMVTFIPVQSTTISHHLDILLNIHSLVTNDQTIAEAFAQEIIKQLSGISEETNDKSMP